MPRAAKSDPVVLQDFLESYTVPTLKGIAGLLASPLPSRKAELVALIQGHLEDPDNLRQLWTSLDNVQQAAVAELEQGGSVGEMEDFLRARAGGDLPDTVVLFFKEMADRASQLLDLGTARLLEAQDAALAQLIANDSRLRPLCMLAGERHIVVPMGSERAFLRALRKLGYGLSSSLGSES